MTRSSVPEFEQFERFRQGWSIVIFSRSENTYLRSCSSCHIERFTTCYLSINGQHEIWAKSLRRGGRTEMGAKGGYSWGGRGWKERMRHRLMNPTRQVLIPSFPSFTSSRTIINPFLFTSIQYDSICGRKIQFQWTVIGGSRWLIHRSDCWQHGFLTWAGQRFKMHRISVSTKEEGKKRWDALMLMMTDSDVFNPIICQGVQADRMGMQ